MGHIVYDPVRLDQKGNKQKKDLEGDQKRNGTVAGKRLVEFLNPVGPKKAEIDPAMNQKKKPKRKEEKKGREPTEDE